VEGCIYNERLYDLCPSTNIMGGGVIKYRRIGRVGHVTRKRERSTGRSITVFTTARILRQINAVDKSLV